jgi:hypothetical protein
MVRVDADSKSLPLLNNRSILRRVELLCNDRTGFFDCLESFSTRPSSDVLIDSERDSIAVSIPSSWSFSASNCRFDWFVGCGSC